MPLGSRHELEGILLRDGADWTLRVDDGGHWRLDLLRWPGRLAGHRIRVRGTRSGFDLLDVSAIVRAGQPFPERWWDRLARGVQRQRRSPP